jgi:hypothetical protein
MQLLMIRRLRFCFHASRFLSSAVSRGGSTEMVSFSILPVNMNDT